MSTRSERGPGRGGRPGTTVIIAVLAGVLAGVATSFVVSHAMLAGRMATSAPARAEDGDPGAGPRLAATPAADDPRVSQLERRLADVERRRLAAPTTPGGAPRPTPLPDLAERRYRDQLRAHGDEASDPQWAAPTAASIEGDLGRLARKGSFKLVGVDCRSQLCTAEVEWPSMAIAAEEHATLVHHPYRANCSRVVVLPDAPPDSDPPRPVKAKLLFECASWRSAGSQPLDLGYAGVGDSN